MIKQEGQRCPKRQVAQAAIRLVTAVITFRNKHSDACIYLPPYKLDVLKIVESKFSSEMEAHVEVTSKRHFNVSLQ